MPLTQWHPQSGTGGFVRALYLNILDRDAENEEVIRHHSSCAFDKGLITTITGFFDSPEYKSRSLSARETVKALYRSILGREPSEDGIAAHSPMVPVNGESMKAMVQLFVTSPEYNERYVVGLAPCPQPSYIEDQLTAIKYRLRLLEEGQLRLQIEDLQRQVAVLEQQLQDEVRWRQLFPLRLHNSRLSPTAPIMLPTGTQLPPNTGSTITPTQLRIATEQQLDGIANALCMPRDDNTTQDLRAQIREYLGILD